MSAAAAALMLACALAASCGDVRDEGRALTGASPAPSAAVATPTPSTLWTTQVGATACGLVRSYVAPTATAEGRLAIGSREYALSPGERPRTPFEVTPGTAMCVWGGIGAPLSAPGSEPIGPGPRCGRVRAFVPPTRATSGRIDMLEYWSHGVLSLPIRPATWPTSPPFDSYRCVAVVVDPTTGDANARELTTDLADIALACGVVKAFTAPTPTTAGSITIGSHTVDLPAGTPYQRDPAGARTDPTSVGDVICLNGILDDAGVVRRYGPNMAWGTPDASGRLPGECGGRGPAAFQAPTTSAPGFISYAIKRPPYPIPAGAPITTAPPCVWLQVDRNGDLIAPAGKTPDPVRL